MGEEDPVLQAVFRVPAEQLPLQLHLHDKHGLVHLGGQGGVHGVEFVFVQDVGGKALTGVVPVDLGGEHGQRPQIDAVAVLQQIEVVVAHAPPQDAGHAGLVAQVGADPGDVVVAPLDVYVVETAQFIQGCTG